VTGPASPAFSENQHEAPVVGASLQTKRTDTLPSSW